MTLKGMHDFKGNFPYDDFFRKTHARLYCKKPWSLLSGAEREQRDSCSAVRTLLSLGPTHCH